MRIALPLLMLALAGPASAEGQRDAFDCAALQSCAPGAGCTPGGPAFTLTFLGGGIEIVQEGESLRPAYDGALTSAAWRRGGAVYQLRLSDDGSGVLTVTPDTGGFAETRLARLQCTPQ